MAVFTENQNTEESTEPCLVVPEYIEQDSGAQEFYISQTLLNNVFLSLDSETSNETTKSNENAKFDTFTFVEPEYETSDITSNYENLSHSLEKTKFSDTINNESLKPIDNQTGYNFFQMAN
ncbi:hypothetical protein CBL_08607 [Carabus blaptoides fortunei]